MRQMKQSLAQILPSLKQVCIVGDITALMYNIVTVCNALMQVCITWILIGMSEHPSDRANMLTRYCQIWGTRLVSVAALVFQGSIKARSVY